MGKFYISDIEGTVIGEFESSAVKDTYYVLVNDGKVVQVDSANAVAADDVVVTHNHGFRKTPSHKTVDLFYNGILRLNKTETLSRLATQKDISLIFRFFQTLPYYDTHHEFFTANATTPMLIKDFTDVFGLSERQTKVVLHKLFDSGVIETTWVNDVRQHRIPKGMYDRNVSKVNVSDLSVSFLCADNIFASAWSQKRIDKDFITLHVKKLRDTLLFMSKNECVVLAESLSTIKAWTNQLVYRNGKNATVDNFADRVASRVGVSKEVGLEAVKGMIKKGVLKESPADGGLFVNPFLMSMTSKIDADTAILFS